MDILQINLIIAKSYNKQLEHKLQNLFKIQIFKSRLKNNGLLKLTIVNQLTKKSDIEKNK